MSKLMNKMITKVMPWHANMTEANHLGAALLTRPEVFEGKMTQLFSAQRYSDNPLTALLAGKSERTINTTEWEWQKRGASTRPLVIVEDGEPTNATPGKFKRNFKLVSDVDWFIPGDVLAPGGDKRYAARVQNQPIRVNANKFIYEMRGMWDADAMFMPKAYLQAGQQWAKLFSQYEEAAEQSGSTQYSTPMTLKSRMSRYRKQYRVTGDAAQEVLAVKLLGSDGKFYDSWIKYAEVEFWEQWHREIEKGYWYGRSTNTVLGANGRPIYSGPGIQELMEDGRQHYYSVLTAKLIEEFLMDIFYSRVKPGKDRKIKAFTGEYGMIQFHRAIQDWAAKKGFIQVVDQMFMQKTNSQYHDNAIAVGYQYVKYRMANGVELELIHNPLYDDREINFELDPVTGYPVESQRITFLDFTGSEHGDGNIVLMNKANSFKHVYVEGLQSPYGPNVKTKAAHSGDYYEMHVQKQCGVHIDDITKCGELILQRA